MSTKISMVTSQPTEIHVYKYRWIILLTFGLVSVINTMQIMEFTIIANIVAKFYDVGDFWVNLTNSIFFGSYIVFFYPVNYCIEKYSMKSNAIMTAAITLLGNTMKIFAAESDRFWLVILAQLSISIGQVHIGSLPSKIATMWFGGGEVSTACAILVLANNFGAALGCIKSPLLVTDGDTVLVSSQLFNMFVYQAIVTGIIFLLVLIFFRSKPRSPPSQSQLDLMNISDSSKTSFWTNIIDMSGNKNVWYLVLSLGSANAIWNTFLVFISEIYVHYFPNGDSDSGFIGLISIIAGGCVGSMLFGILLDKTHQFKLTAIAILSASAVSIILVAISCEYQSRLATYFVIPMFGFCICPVVIVGFEYLVEMTYPIPEECSNTIFNVVFNVVGVFLTVLLQKLLATVAYVWTFVALLGLVMFCAGIALLINTDLKRRDANLKGDCDSDIIEKS